ncbi:hypothetical protein QBC42DRAFT_337452 [Cladorrhinum samala]|uniref:Uncharacterized protein n=1 Tax=Cladorrhinum samala TaxID=585594 RepID=A0AAV9HUW6_9PEZI|nr:hypothetical protein QBC42DRAFT_337452 [Cladorrhinum samala]
MLSKIQALLAAATALWAFAGHAAPAEDEPIYRDVAIIGGGASGSYAAVRLREDYNMSVIVIEKGDRLGGHVNTWVDQATGRGFEAGVQNYIDLPGAKEFFARIGIPIANSTRAPNEQVYVDFTTGQRLAGFVPPQPADRTEALRRYLAFAEQYVPIMEPGWWNFPKDGADIPPELLLPFRDIVDKYNLSAAVPQIFATTGFGMHDLMGSLALWVIRSFNVDMVRVLLGINAGFVPASRRNQDLYDAILARLGKEAVVLSSTVATFAKAPRKSRMKILGVANSATGEITHRFKVKAVLFTAAPAPANIAPFATFLSILPDLGPFAAFKFSATHVGVVSHRALPLKTTLANTRSESQPARYPLSPPAHPFNARFENYADSSVYRVMAVGDENFTDPDRARAVVETSFEKMMAAGTIGTENNTTSTQDSRLEFKYWQPHGLVNAYIDAEDLKKGALGKIHDFQAYYDFYWTGAAWSVHLTTGLWQFTDTVLERLVGDLKKIWG